MQYLFDVGYFSNKFRVEVLEQDVLPWLENKVEDFVKELDEFYQFPDTIVDEFAQEFRDDHRLTVEQER